MGKEILKYLGDLKLITDEMSEEKKLAIIQSEFECLYDPNHPVRFAIETLDSVEEVRIIRASSKSRRYWVSVIINLKISELPSLLGSKDFLVEFRKDIYNEEYLTNLGLNEQQIKAVIFTKKKGKITNSDHQKLNNVSKRTATNELTELVDLFKVLVKSRTMGAGVHYETMGQ